MRILIKNCVYFSFALLCFLGVGVNYSFAAAAVIHKCLTTRSVIAVLPAGWTYLSSRGTTVQNAVGYNYLSANPQDFYTGYPIDIAANSRGICYYSAIKKLPGLLIIYKPGVANCPTTLNGQAIQTNNQVNATFAGFAFVHRDTTRPVRDVANGHTFCNYDYIVGAQKQAFPRYGICGKISQTEFNCSDDFISLTLPMSNI